MDGQPPSVQHGSHFSVGLAIACDYPSERVLGRSVVPEIGSQNTVEFKSSLEQVSHVIQTWQSQW
jgi:hypothetical protein